MPRNRPPEAATGHTAAQEDMATLAVTQLIASTPESPDTVRRALVVRLAQLWAMVGAYSSGTVPEDIDASNRQTMREVAGVLYRFRDDLRGMLPAQVYQELDRAMGWQVFDRASAAYAETGDFRSAVEAYVAALRELVPEA